MDTSDKIALASSIVAGVALIAAVASAAYARRQAHAAVAANALSAQANAAADRATAIADRAAVESQRARLDARAPQVTVTNGEVIWPPLTPSGVANTTGTPLSPGHQFHIPQDESLLVGIRASFEIKSGQAGVAVHVNGELAPESRLHPTRNPTFDPPRWLGPGETLKIFLEGYAPLAKWIEAARSPDGVEDVHQFQATVSYSDGFNTGITDTVRVLVAARGLHEDVNRQGLWSFQPELVMHGEAVHCTTVEIGNRQRLYWESRDDSRPVAEPAPDRTR